MANKNKLFNSDDVVTQIDNTAEDNVTAAKKKRGPSLIIFIFSLLAAIIFWVYVLGYDSATEEMKIKQVEIEITGITELFETRGYTITESDDLKTDIIITGKKSVLSGVKNEDIKAYINVEDVDEEGTVSRQVLFDVPNGVTVKSSTISYYKFDVIRAISQKFKIGYVPGEISYDSSCSLGEVTCSPSYVQITGSESLISQISRVVVSLDFGNMNSSKLATRTLLFKDSRDNDLNVDNLELSCSSVEVSAELLKTKEIPVNVKSSGFIDPTYLSISCSPEKVKIIGEISEIDGISDFEVQIDESKIHDELTYYKSFYFPNTVKQISEEEGVTINVSLVNLDTKTVVVMPEDITYLNIPSDFSCILNDTEKHIVFKGTRDSLSDFTKSGFSCRVNFADQNYESGKSYDCALEIIIPENTRRVFAVGEYSVNVTMYKTLPTNVEQ